MNEKKSLNQNVCFLCFPCWLRRKPYEYWWFVCKNESGDPEGVGFQNKTMFPTRHRGYILDLIYFCNNFFIGTHSRSIKILSYAVCIPLCGIYTVMRYIYRYAVCIPLSGMYTVMRYVYRYAVYIPLYRPEDSLTEEQEHDFSISSGHWKSIKKISKNCLGL